MKPNIVLLVFDDLGLRDLTPVKMPRTWALAREWTTVANHWSEPLCLPTRVTMMCSQYASHHGWIGNWQVSRMGHAAPDPDYLAPTIGDVMQASGYYTTAIGKWMLGDRRDDPMAPDRWGFNEWYLWPGPERGAGKIEHRDRWWGAAVWSRGKVHYDESSVFSETRNIHILQELLSTMSVSHFVYYASLLPHYPIPDPMPDDLPQTRDGMLRLADDVVGAVWDAVREANGILIVTSDNGSPEGEDGKGTLEDDGIHVPLILCGDAAPGPRGGSRLGIGVTPSWDILTDATDVPRLCADLAGAKISAEWHGRPLGTREWHASMGIGGMKLNRWGHVVPGYYPQAPRRIGGRDLDVTLADNGLWLPEWDARLDQEEDELLHSLVYAADRAPRYAPLHPIDGREFTRAEWREWHKNRLTGGAARAGG